MTLDYWHISVPSAVCCCCIVPLAIHRHGRTLSDVGPLVHLPKQHRSRRSSDCTVISDLHIVTRSLTRFDELYKNCSWDKLHNTPVSLELSDTVVETYSNTMSHFMQASLLDKAIIKSYKMQKWIRIWPPPTIQFIWWGEAPHCITLWICACVHTGTANSITVNTVGDTQCPPRWKQILDFLGSQSIIMKGSPDNMIVLSAPHSNSRNLADVTRRNIFIEWPLLIFAPYLLDSLW